MPVPSHGYVATAMSLLPVCHRLCCMVTVGQCVSFISGYLSKMHAYCSRVAALLHIVKVAGRLSSEPYFSDSEDYAEVAGVSEEMSLIDLDSVERALVLCKSSIKQHIIYTDFREAAPFFFSNFDVVAFTDKLRSGLAEDGPPCVDPPMVSLIVVQKL